MADVRYIVSTFLLGDMDRCEAHCLMICLNDMRGWHFFVALHCKPLQVQVKVTICLKDMQLWLLLSGFLFLDWHVCTNLPCDPLSLSMWEDNRTQHKHRMAFVSQVL